MSSGLLARRRALVPTVLIAVFNATLPSDVEAQPSKGDTAKTHSVLRDAIDDFQSAWRKSWRDMEFKRYGLLDSQNMGFATDPQVANTRRFFAIGCETLTPLIVPHDMIGGKSVIVARYPVVVKPDRGAICPMYFPPLEDPIPDDAANIDLAIPYTARSAMKSARSSLISRISSVLLQNPTDEWVAGQLVRFTYDQNDPKRTVAAAARCINKSALCAQLSGFAFEQSGDLFAADSAFRVADKLAEVDSPSRNGNANHPVCAGDDVMQLLSIPEKARMLEASCERQRELVDQLWWLADPLWATPGNERYVAHNSRSIHVTIRSVSLHDERYDWDPYGVGRAMRAMVIRYGWPSHTFVTGLVKRDPNARRTTMRFDARDINANTERPKLPSTAPITAKEYTFDRTHFLPTFDAVEDPFILNESHFNLYPPEIDEGKRATPDYWWPVEHYKYPYLITALPKGQDATWRRDSTIRYQLAVDNPLRSLDPGAKGFNTSLLVGGADAASTRLLAQSEVGEGYTLRLLTDLKSQPIVLSAEVLPRTTKEAAMRLRFGMRPPPTLRNMKANEFALSPPVFMRMPNRDMKVPSDEASVLRYMAGDLAFPATETLALYWESYGFVPGDTMQYELKFKRADDINAARRIGSFLGIVSELRDSVSIRWTEPDGRHTSTVLTGTKPTVGRSIAVDLRALPPGTYIVSMEMRKNATTFARSERKFVVKEP